jgi:hypothetical protein
MTRAKRESQIAFVYNENILLFLIEFYNLYLHLCIGNQYLLLQVVSTYTCSVA